MFTADGELREEYRRRQEEAAETSASVARPGEARPGEARPGEARPPEPTQALGGPIAPARPGEARPGEARPGEARPGEARPGEARSGEAPSGEAGFLDLIGLLAEPASIYLREAQAADPQTAAQSLELARLHIDLLIVLQDKTEGNLSSSEKAMLEDVVYQLRSGYVGLRG